MSLFFLNYIRILARVQLAKMRLLNPRFKIVGISGSAGKTSTMMAIYAVLRDHLRVKYSDKANSESGIPLDILGLHPKTFTKLEWLKLALLAPLQLLLNWKVYDVYIVEMGVDAVREPKNMAYLLKILVPDVAVYLNVNAIHAANYEEGKKLSKEELIDLIAADKALLIKALPSQGLAILNADDPRVLQTRDQTIAQIKLLAKEKLEPVIEIPGYVLASHYQYTFHAALLVAEYFGIQNSTALNDLQQNFHLEPGRNSIFAGVYNSLIIDSSYNSSPEPLLDMLDLLDTEAKKQKALRIAVLGDIRELGSATASEHKRVAKYAASKADLFYLIGPNMNKYFLPELLKQKVNTKFIKNFIRASDCAAQLSEDLAKLSNKKLILVKGSQNTIFLEIVVEKLLASKQDADKLCRRSEFWMQQKQGY